MKKLFLSAALLALPLPALASNWLVIPEQSALTFSATEQGTAFEGKFPTFTASIEFDASDLANAKADVAVALKGIDTGSEERDETLAGDDWFNVSKFPTAHFVTSAFRHVEGNKYEAEGTLTIGEVSQPVTLPFTLDITGETAVMKGEVTLDRSSFKLGQATDEATAGKLATVHVTLTAHRQ